MSLSEWTAALRSDRYEQTTGELVTFWTVNPETTERAYGTPESHEGRAHCCLGVACEAAGYQPDREGGGTYLGIASILPGAVAQWLGLNVDVNSTYDPYIDFPDGFDDRDEDPLSLSCTQANDELHLNFHQIADLVDYFGIRVG